MKRSLAVAFSILALPVVSSATTPPSVAGVAADRSPALRVAGVAPASLDRRVIDEDLAHYQLDLRVGPAEHDVIRLHRVVRERAPWRPIRTPRAVMMAHGDGWAFEANFLPPGGGLASHLAEADIDVWGLDYRWARVAAETTDLAFMADWSFGTSLDDLDAALAAARVIRAVTGSGPGRLHLLGFSRGGQLGWAQLGAETQRPSWRRHVRGFVAVDHAFKTDDEIVRASNCDSVDAIQAQIDGGTVSIDYAITRSLGVLALDEPDAPSPLFPSSSNADLATFIGASPGGGAIAHFHAVGGDVDPETLETTLRYTSPTRWFTYLASIASFQPLGLNLEGAQIVCDEVDVPYDDHLDAITASVLYVGVDGGFGALGIYQTTLIGSTDVTTMIVDQVDDPVLDVGHNDPFLADDAVTLVWQPIRDWLLAR